MLRHINCISGEENYASGGAISEEEKALELKCTHVRAHTGLAHLQQSPEGRQSLSSPLQAEIKGTHVPLKSVLDEGERDLLHWQARAHAHTLQVIITGINKFTPEAQPEGSLGVYGVNIFSCRQSKKS